MKVKDIISQLEKNMGRQPEGYIMRLINDGLLDIAAERQHKIDDMKMDLVQNKRWYEIDDRVIDITRVEILSQSSSGSCSDSSYTTKTTCESNGGTWTESGNRYVMVPKLADAHKLLKEDEY
jgi:hypothetical protein